MTASFWDDFLIHAEKTQTKSSVFFSILRQIKPIEVTDEKIILKCENHGIKIYLEKKIDLLQDLLESYLKKKVVVELLIPEKKKREVSPLLSFQPSKEDYFVRAGLNLKNRFDNFAVSSSNQVAYAAAQAVQQNIGTAYNPFFLYGGVGVGKTHLAQAIARSLLEKDHEKKVFFCPGDQFLNELIDSIRERSTARFRRKYRSLNLLIVDDIQFIAGKKSVQEEFFHTFNAVVSAGGQIILTSDRPPQEIKELEDRLRSRFSGGLIVDVQAPDFELRTAILLIKASEKNIEIDIEAAKIIAQEVPDTRALEGALLSAYTKALGKKDRIDLEVVEDFFQEKSQNIKRRVSSQDVIKTVCSFYNIKVSHIKSETRTSEVALTRQIIMYLLRNELKMKLEEVAYTLKRKDHTTVMHGVEKVQRLLMNDARMKEEVDKIVQSIRSST